MTTGRCEEWSGFHYNLIVHAMFAARWVVTCYMHTRCTFFTCCVGFKACTCSNFCTWQYPVYYFCSHLWAGWRLLIM